MLAHPDDFMPFLPSLDGEDGAGATSAAVITPAGFQVYCARIRDTGVWGGEPEILALAKAYRVPIHVIQGQTPHIVVHSPDGEGAPADETRVVRISYHRRMYGLGEVSAPLVWRDPNSALIP